jgi:asparagine synthase (glutamine-hydrolysing)
MPDPEHGVFVFRGPDGVGSARLARVVAAECRPLDVDALAAAALAMPPNDPVGTPYRDVTRRTRGEQPVGLGAGARALRSAEDATGWLRDLLERAIDRALYGVTRVGVLAGGGLDSAAVLALACRWAERTGGSAFAVALDYEAEGDDRPHLRALERHLGCEVVRVSPEQAAPRIALIDGVDAAPFPWPTGAFEVEMLAVARAHGAERCLSGAGGDELFNGNPSALSTYVRQGQLAEALGAARRLEGFDRPRSRVLSWLVRPLLAPIQPASLHRWRARYRPASAPRWVGPAAHAFLRARDAIDRVAAHRDYVAWLRHQEIVASGCDLREPFFDADVVRAIGELPPAWLLHGNARRGLFREAMRGLLPESLRTRADKARFEPAVARFFEAAGGAARLRDLASLSRLVELGIVTPTHSASTFEAFAGAPCEAESWLALWPALAVEAFLRASQGGAQVAH